MTLVSAEILDSRRRGGCLPVSRELELDVVGSSCRVLDVRLRFPFPDSEEVGLDFLPEVD